MKRQTVLKAVVVVAALGMGVMFGRLLGGLLVFHYQVHAQAGDQQVPALVLKHSLQDFGAVSAGRKLSARFPIRNDGRRRLILREEFRNCSCLTGGKPEIIVAPGKTVELEVIMHTSQLSGAVRKLVRYRTNDPKLPMLTVRLVAEVEPAAGAISHF